MKLSWPTGARGSRSTASLPSSTRVSELSISVSRLFHRDVGRVHPDVELHRLRGLLPFAEVASFSASNVQNEQAPFPVDIESATPVHPLCPSCFFGAFRQVVLVRRELLDDGALDPVVEASKAADPAVRLAPVSASFRYGIVVFSDNILSPSIVGLGLSLASSRLFSLFLSLSQQLFLRRRDP